MREAPLRCGLTAAQIASLPCKTATRALVKQMQDIDCPICLCPLQIGDSVRSLDSCSHTFHRACIDLWLLRRADCPLCKASVIGSIDADGSNEEDAMAPVEMEHWHV